MPSLLYQGHASYRIRSDRGQFCYVDPCSGTGYDPAATLVIVTHEHPDHNKVSLVTLREGQGRILRARDLLKDGVYQTEEVGDFAVIGVPAYNSNHNRDECVGALIDVDGVTVYAAGDTSYTDFMLEFLAEIHIDYALLPIDGVLNMGPEEAVFCADIIRAEHTIPIHTSPGSLYDISTAQRFTHVNRLIVEPGTEIALQARSSARAVDRIPLPLKTLDELSDRPQS